ncbi:hypothetical protein [Agromyces seonyuensis]|uniref:Uncharacterized protein n=1 Tax=Agromyces seonyuensis TaxID=2662446 RepID=A0A6I4P7B5_9MICO|nr:hypothetical protein [Agromyces seonyuensis]MWB99684.1 hypothetical protein [Agromyces seonyuensis]
MSVHYQLPTAADFAVLGGAHDPAISLYASTSPVVAERERARTAVRSLFTKGLDQVKSRGASAADVEALRVEIDAVDGDLQLWGGLSRSLAIFIAPGFSETFVLPNRLDDEVAVGSHFSLGQLLRAPSQEQEAYALAVSANGWSLWHATPTDRAVKLDVPDSEGADLDSVTNREPGEERPGHGGPRGDRSRLVGDEGRKTLLDIYAKRVVDSARKTLGELDPEQRVPVFVFATEPLLSLIRERASKTRRVVLVGGNPDRLGAAEIDFEIRSELAKLNVAEASTQLKALADDNSGRVETDLAAIGRQAVDGAVLTYWFDFTRSVNGCFDAESGAIEYAVGDGTGDALADGTPAGDLLPQIAMLVARKGGTIVTVRADDLDPDVWTGPAVAELRFALV